MQTPSEKALREGEVAVSSTRLGLLLEAEAALDRGYRVEPVRERYVNELLERRSTRQRASR